jgi:hypothetical protein
MNRAKYIILESDRLGIVPVIFPISINHSDMRSAFVGGKVLGAGFVDVHNGRLEAFGESITLKVASRAEDSDILNRLVGS